MRLITKKDSRTIGRCLPVGTLAPRLPHAISVHSDQGQLAADYAVSHSGGRGAVQPCSSEGPLLPKGRQLHPRKTTSRTSAYQTGATATAVTKANPQPCASRVLRCRWLSGLLRSPALKEGWKSKRAKSRSCFRPPWSPGSQHRQTFSRHRTSAGCAGTGKGSSCLNSPTADRLATSLGGSLSGLSSECEGGS